MSCRKCLRYVHSACQGGSHPCLPRLAVARQSLLELGKVSVGHLNQLVFASGSSASDVGGFKMRVATIGKAHFELTGEVKRHNVPEQLERLINFARGRDQHDQLDADFAFRPFMKLLNRVIDVVAKCKALLQDGQSFGTVRQASVRAILDLCLV